MTAPALAEHEFHALRDIVYSRTGIRFEDSKRSYVEKRVLERMRAQRVKAPSRYISSLKTNLYGKELQELINLLTVNETYFFREEYQLRCLAASMMPELVRVSGRSSFRVWSLPCSTGEEPYSIAIYLLETFKGVDDYEIEIVASDVDTTVLKAAARGVYAPRALQHVSKDLLERYFEPVADGNWRICDGLRDSVTFNTCNLVDRTQMINMGRFDVVFCRNVLIYFDAVSRRLAADNIFDVLLPGGFICLGHSESMSRISSRFDVRKFEEAIVYQRPERK